MDSKKIFWLHIKKSAGTSVRQILHPVYSEVERVKNPGSFIQSDPEFYNDILNNYRIPLGDYQFKRCLFAEKYLYPSTWENLFSFAFSREPVSRCVSMFFYMYWRDPGVGPYFRYLVKHYLRTNRLHYNVSSSFDVFLDLIEATRSSGSIYRPVDLHFATHTAAVSGDVTDLDGKIMLKKIYRLEDLTQGINQVFERCGIDKKVSVGGTRFNENSKKGLYKPNSDQLKKIMKLYDEDFEIYENAKNSLRQ